MKDPYGKKALDRTELKLLRDLIPFGIWNSIIEQYEDQWLEKRISNAKFEKYWIIFTKLGFQVSTKEELISWRKTYVLGSGYLTRIK